MNSFIFNGKSSDSFGIVVNSLPPIKKAAYRTEKIEIDGRDGDIINVLGYAAYDKEIQITRFDKNIDVNIIIEWLNTDEYCKLVMSNEPDKYYLAKIIESIDFTRFENFETVSLKFHVQPYKYKYNEEKTIYEATGNINDVKETTILSDEDYIEDLQIFGESMQETRSGKNFFNANLITRTDIIVENNGQKIIMPTVISGNGYTNLYQTLSELCPSLKVGDKVVLKLDTTSENNKFIHLLGITYTWRVNEELTITEEALNGYVYLYANNWYAGETEQVIITDMSIMLASETDQTYEPYGTMPSPKFQSEIESITSPVNIKSTEKNRLNLTSVSGSYNEKTPTLKNGVINVKGTNDTSKIDRDSFYHGYVNLNTVDKWEDNKTYYFSCKVEIISNQKEIDTSYFYCFLFGTTKFKIIYNAETGRYEGKISPGAGLPENKKYVEFRVSGCELNISEVMLTIEETYNYEAYKESITPIPLLHDMRSLPNGIRDRIYYEDGKWYDEQKTGSCIANLREFITLSNGNIGGVLTPTNKIRKNNNSLVCSHALFDTTRNFIENTIYENEANVVLVGNSTDTSETIKAKYDGAEVLYELAEPIITEITDEATIKALESIKTYKGITNITADTNFSGTYYKEKEISIINEGNIESTPIIILEGKNKIITSDFSYTFDSDNKVVIDSLKEDAYLNENLKNRNMNGDFPKFNKGNNIFSWIGRITKIIIENKSRWI